MPKLGIQTNPFNIRTGDFIATSSHPSGEVGPYGAEYHTVAKSREVKRVEPFRCSSQCIHLDHECYDSRFSTVIKVIK